MYGSVVTRCFGYGVPYTCMVPMGDNFNHSDSFSNSYEIINPLMHLRPDKKDLSIKNNTYFNSSKFMNDYSLVFNEVERECYSSDIKGHFNRKAFLQNVEKRTEQAWRNELKREEVQIWNLSYKPRTDECDDESSDESDNESSDSSNRQEEVKGLDDYIREQEEENKSDDEVKKWEKQCDKETKAIVQDTYLPYEDFSWFKCDEVTQGKREMDTYLAFYNDIRRDIQPGEQLYYFYGQRSNIFLFLNYGFVLEFNKFDSYELYVNMKLDEK